MPRISSILYKNDSPNDLQRYGCCQFLHTTGEDYTGLVPLKYMFNHKDISERFKNWVNFLNDDLELGISYRIQEKQVTGWRSLKEFNEVYERYKEMYMMTPPPGQTYSGVYGRTTSSNFQLGKGTTAFSSSNRDRISFGIYVAGNLTAPVKKSHYAEPKYLMDRTDLPTFPVSFAHVSLPTGLAPEHNGFKYIAWYMLRMYPTYQQISNFILDNRKKLEEIMIKYNIGWWNIIFAVHIIFNMSHFGCRTIQKIVKEDIESALEIDSKRYETEHSVRFNYRENELFIAGAMERYCPKVSDETISRLPRHSSMVNWSTDNPNGQATNRESAKVLHDIKTYFNLLTKDK